MNLLKLFSATSPIPYAISAALVTLLAILGGYIHYKFTQKKLKLKLEIIKNATDEGSRSTQEFQEDEMNKALDDPNSPCANIPGKIKKIQQRRLRKELEAEMSEGDKKKEKDTQRKQLAAIFELVKKQENKFGVGSEDELKDQMRLYTQ